MDFSGVWLEYVANKGRYERGEISYEAFVQAVNGARLQDANGNYWQVSPHDGKWIRYDGQNWVADTPPQDGVTFDELPEVKSSALPAEEFSELPVVENVPVSAGQGAVRSTPTPQKPKNSKKSNWILFLIIGLILLCGIGAVVGISLVVRSSSAVTQVMETAIVQQEIPTAEEFMATQETVADLEPPATDIWYDQDILGRWVLPDEYIMEWQYDFLPDGTLHVFNRAGDEKMGWYVFTDAQTVQLWLDGEDLGEQPVQMADVNSLTLMGYPFTRDENLPQFTFLPFADDFSDPESGFGSGEKDTAVWGYEAGQYFVNTTKEDYMFYILPDDFTIAAQDVVITMDAIKKSGVNPVSADLICRYQDDDNFYDFSVWFDGYYMISKYADGGWESLAGGQEPDPAVNVGNTTNYIEASCIGNTLTLTVNGQMVAQVEDDSFLFGEVGFAASTDDGIPEAKIYFDNYYVFAP